MQAGLQVERHGPGHEGPGSEPRSASAGSSVNDLSLLVTSFLFSGTQARKGAPLPKMLMLPAVRVAPDAAGKSVREQG